MDITGLDTALIGIQFRQASSRLVYMVFAFPNLPSSKTRYLGLRTNPFRMTMYVNNFNTFLILVARSSQPSPAQYGEGNTGVSSCWLYSVQNELYQVRRLSKSDSINSLTHFQPLGHRLFRNHIRCSCPFNGLPFCQIYLVNKVNKPLMIDIYDPLSTENEPLQDVLVP